MKNIIYYTKNQELSNWMKRGQSIEANTKMAEIVEFSANEKIANK